jgi:site-specific recombinase XerD
MMLTLGADLYTTSKLLGHANVTTTQIYSKIIDKKKVETVNLVDNLFTPSTEQTTDNTESHED